MVNIIIPTLEHPHSKKCFDSLKHIPFEYKLIKVTDDTNGNWGEAINIGLSRIDNVDGDILIMDDDVILKEETFKSFEKYYDRADVFGFKLLYENETIQHGGGYFNNGVVGHNGHGLDRSQCSKAMYVVHCTASLLYIKRKVMNTLVRMNSFSGVQFEDVDFSYRALINGFDILYIPNEAYHLESNTKKNSVPEFQQKMNRSWNELCEKYYNFDNNLLLTKLNIIGRGINLNEI